MTQKNLGNVFLTLGERESGTAQLEEAAAYREALQEYTRARTPFFMGTNAAEHRPGPPRFFPQGSKAASPRRRA
jgi:hypothetical protein